MNFKTDEPSIPESIQKKIEDLQHLLRQADDLRDEILAWYEAELKSYDPGADPGDELFDPGTGIAVEILKITILVAFRQAIALG